MNDLIAYRLGKQRDTRITVGAANREWMDNTDRSFANRCLPMLVANQAGWLILNDRTVRAQWHGTIGPDSMEIEQPGPPPYLALSHFGHGILTFTVPFLFRTSPGTALLFRGPANSPKDGIAPLEGLVETDWSVATATMNWKFTRPNTWVEFALGEPICMLVPQNISVLESFRPRILDIREDPDTYRRYKLWSKARRQFLENLRRLEPETVKEGWQRDYIRGREVTNDREHTEHAHRTKLKLCQFVDSLRATTERSDSTRDEQIEI